MKLKIYIPLVIFILQISFYNNIFSQTAEIDSLENVLKKEQIDTNRVNILNKIAQKYYDIDLEKTLQYALLSDSLSGLIAYKKGKAESLNIISFYYYMKSYYPIALEYYQKSLKINEELNNKSAIAKTLNYIGIIHYLQKDYNQANNYFSKSLEIQKEIENKQGISGCLNNIGIILEEQGDFSQALENYQKSLDIDYELNDDYGISKSLNNIGRIYCDIDDYSKSIEYLEKALEIATKNNFQHDLSYINYCFGTVYLKKKEYDKALNFTLKSLEIAKESELLDVLKDVYEQMSMIYAGKKDYKNAYENHILYKSLNDSLFNEENIKKIINLESKYEFDKQKHELEIEQQKKDAINAEEIKRQKIIRNFLLSGFLVLLLLLAQIFLSLNQKKKANKLLALQKKEIEEKNEELLHQKEEILAQAEELEVTNQELEKLSLVASETDNAIMIIDKNGNFEWVNEGVCKLYGYSKFEFIEKYPDVFSVSSNPEIKNIIKKAFENKETIIYETETNSKNGEQIWVQTTLTPILDITGKITKIIEIDSDIRKLKSYEKELQIKNEHITSSIRYAQTIQKAILPLQEKISKYFDNFIIYRPKDIVSGDFYWYVKTEKYFFVAVADCTGHGVPGAFMSMIGSSLLNQILYNIKQYDTAKILTKLNDLVIFSLRQDVIENNDGMDICLCRIEKNDNSSEIQFTGAKLSLLYFNNHSAKIEKIKGNRKSIGGSMSNLHSVDFTAYNFNAKKNDVLFLYTDGLIDQNNFNRRKFGTKKLIQCLEQNINKSFDFQQKIISQKLDDWMNNTVQRDDITLWAIKI